MRILKLFTLVAIAMMVFASYNSVPTRAQGALTIGFSQIGSESGWRTSETASIKAEAEKRGINLLFDDAQQKQENQIKALRSFIAQGVDAILLAPVVETGWDDVLKEAKEADIPVVLVDRGVKVDDDSVYLTKVSSDFVHEGRLAASWLAQRTNGICQIVELQGTVGSSAAIDRQTGFADVIALFPGMVITRSQSGDFTRDGGKKVMEAFLKAQDPKTICAVWAHNDDMVLGAIQAIKEAGLKPGVDILTISVDAVPDIFKAMADGEANATVELSPDLGGPAFDAINDFKAGKEVPKWIVSTSPMYFPATAAEEYAKRSAK
jgi:galactofuranose transport system substrate-binding protein